MQTLVHHSHPCRHRNEFFKLVGADGYDWNVASHKELLRSMMMTACDVSAITKPWPVQKQVTSRAV